MLERNSSFVLQEKRREGWRLKASVKVNRKKLLLILCRLRCTNTNLPPWKSVWVVSAQKDKMSTGFVLFVLFLSFWLSSFQLFTVPSEGDYLLCRQGILIKKRTTTSQHHPVTRPSLWSKHEMILWKQLLACASFYVFETHSARASSVIEPVFLFFDISVFSCCALNWQHCLRL